LRSVVCDPGACPLSAFSVVRAAGWRLAPVLAIAVPAAFLTAGCEEIVDFSGQPREETGAVSAQAQLTPVYVAERIEMEALEQTLTNSVPAQLGEISDRVRKASCRTDEDGDKICRDVIITGAVLRDGDLKLTGTPTGFELTVPVRVQLKVRDSKGERTEDIVHRSSVTAVIAGGLDEAWVASMAHDGRLTWTEPPEFAVFEGKYNFGDDINGLLRRRIGSVADVLKAALQPRELKAMTQGTWRALQTPVQIAERPDIWLFGEPVDVRFGGFRVRPDRRAVEIRSAVVTRLRTVVGQRPTPMWPRPMVQLSVAPSNAVGGVVLPVDIGYDQLSGALETGSAKGTLPVPPSVTKEPVEPVNYTIKSFKVQPAGVRVAVGVDLALAIPGSMRSLRGYAYYLCTPEVREGDTLLRLTKADLFEPATIPEAYRDRVAPLLQKAFAERVELATTYDLGPAMQQAMALMNTAADRQIAEGLHLKGQLTGWKVRNAEPGRTALRLYVEFLGELSVSNGRAAVAVGAAAPEPGLPPQP
jgi:Domain of unknown function (DUF4403)